MDSDYKLFQSSNNNNNINTDIHSYAYYKFIDNTKNQIQKIEDEYYVEESSHQNNLYDLIKEYEQEFENQRENCLNNYSTLRDEISEIENNYPEIDIGVFSGFFQNFEEFYLFFSRAKEILGKFMEVNDDIQNLYYILEKKSFCIAALKDMNMKMSEEFAQKLEKYEKIEQDYKELLISFNNIKNITKNTIQTDDIICADSEKLIEQLNEKIDDLTKENTRLKISFSENEKKLENLKIFMKSSCVLRSKSQQSIDELQFKIMRYENDNMNLQKMLNDLRIENEKLILEKENLESQINSYLNKMNFNDENKRMDSDTLIAKNSNENLENNYKTNDVNLEYLLDEEEDDKNENNNKEDSSSKLNTNDNIGNNNVNVNEDNRVGSNNNIDNGNGINTVNIDNNNNANKQKRVSLRILRKNIKKGVKDVVKDDLNLSFNNLKHKKIAKSGINKAYKLMFLKNRTKKNIDYLKQFFFLLFQSMKMNSNEISKFLNFDPEVLYTECKNQHVPYYKFQEWLNEKFPNDENKVTIKENFSTITGIFCTHLI